MASPNRPARLNRTLLILLGLLLLLAGGFGLAFGTGLLGGLLPGLDPSAPLLPDQISPPTWAAYATIVVAVIVGLLCLRWLLAQTQRRPKTGTWTLGDRGDSSPTGVTTLDSDHAADALAADIEGYEHVSKAAAALVGDHRHPVVHLEVTAETTADLAVLRDRITSHALVRLRAALDSDGADVDMILRLTSPDSGRARLS